MIALSVKNQGISAFSQIQFSEQPYFLDVSGNPIKNFKGLGMFISLEILNCDQTKLASFASLDVSSQITEFSCKKTQLAGMEFLDIMACIAFGSSLQKVNQTSIQRQIKVTAEHLSKQLRPLLLQGWVIQSLTPISLLHLATRKRKIIYVSQQQEEREERESEEEQKEEEQGQSEEAQLADSEEENEDDSYDLIDAEYEEMDEEEILLRRRYYELVRGIHAEMKPQDLAPTRLSSTSMTSRCSSRLLSSQASSRSRLERRAPQ